ncbi:MAG: DUF2513 domain-containing protein [Firmicutes bacterium]|nr:DUF2513 domain-containing protein [Bacillota bacterium]
MCRKTALWQKAAFHRNSGNSHRPACRRAGYTQNEIEYTCIKLSEAGYLEIKILNRMGQITPTIVILDITYNGHEFLNKIKNVDIWAETKTPVCRQAGKQKPWAVSL